MDKDRKDPLFEKIESLILRDNIIMAEKMLKKHEASLTESQKKELQRKIVEQHKKKMRRQKKKQKYDKKILKHANIRTYWDTNAWVEPLLIYSWCAFSFLLYPYSEMKDSTVVPPFLQENLIMESIYLVYLFLALVYLGVKFFIDHRNKKIQKEEMIRAKNCGNLSFDYHDDLEKYYAKREKRWLIPLFAFLFLTFIQIVYMVKRFSS